MTDFPFSKMLLSDNSGFAIRLQQISQQLQQDKIQAVGLFSEDAVMFSCMLFACLNANVRVLLPPNLLAENQQWITENADLFFTDDNIAEYGRLQKITEKRLFVDKQKQTEIWLKTSGSSGNAKVIVKTARQMWCEVEAISRVLPFKKTEIYLLGSVSIQHLYGLTYRIFLSFEMNWLPGREQLHYPEYLISESKHYKKALWISSPALLNNLNLDNPDLQKCSIAGIISAGGALPEHVEQAIRKKLNVPVIEVYGSSETGTIALRQNSALWQPMAESRLGVNEQGALWVESPWISQREQTADAVEFSGQHFQLLGRTDRIVKVGDKRISLVKIEQDLLKHPWVNDCYVALHPQHSRALAWIALTNEGAAFFRAQGRRPLIEELKRFLARTQERLALPRFWRFSAILPRNSQSKISRNDFEAVCKTPVSEELR